MLFNSLDFLFFFIIVSTIYFAIPHSLRWLFLLLASCFFYMSFIPVYILILFLTILIDYTAAILIEKSPQKHRRLLLCVSIFANCAVLFIFKYFNFFQAQFAPAIHLFHKDYQPFFLNIILPIGLSFHIFQSLSYVIEVYFGRFKAERHLGIYALYVMFYPQLVAGPIERPQNLLPQFRIPHTFDCNRAIAGLKLMAWGLFKKAVIADRLAVYVDRVYDNLHIYGSSSILLATIFFSIQIYCDFSGYSDIALGAAEIMGFKLMRNFNRPYFAHSVSEFWTRWHISLSSWFRDYVYIPLGGGRVNHLLWVHNIYMTFLLSGLWHGAARTYLVWGLFHATLIVVSRFTTGFRNKIAQTLGLMRMPRLHALIQIGITFSLVTFGWIFFRAKTLTDISWIFKTMVGSLEMTVVKPFIASYDDGFYLGITGLACLFLLWVEWNQTRNGKRVYVENFPFWLRAAFYNVLILSICFLGRFEDRQFIYFQF